MLSISESIRFKMLYFFMFGAYGVLMPYFPLFFDTLGINKAQIGILSMLPNFCSFLVAPLFSVLGDKFNAHGELMIITLLVSTVSTYAMLYMRSFGDMTLMVAICSVFRAPLGPQVDSMVISSLEDKSTYGSFRLWGAIGFGIFAFVGGALTNKTSDVSDSTDSDQEDGFKYLFFMYAIFTLIAGLTILSRVFQEVKENDLAAVLRLQQSLQPNNNTTSVSTAVSTVKHHEAHININSFDDHHYTHNPAHDTPDEDEVENEEVEDDSESNNTTNSRQSTHTSPNAQNPLDNSSPPTPDNGNNNTQEHTNNSTHHHHHHHTAGSEGVMTAVARVFYYNPSVSIFAIVVFLSGIGSGVIDVFLILRLKQLGASGIVMGVARFITCAAEVPMFQIAGSLQKRFGTWPVMAVTQTAFVVRFVYYSMLVEPWAVLPCEILHGLTFATTWNVSCTYASEISPPGCHSTMQALLEGLHWGIGSGLGALVGGFLYDSFGAVRLFQISAGMAVFSTVLSLLASRYCSTVVRYSADDVSGSSVQHSAIAMTGCGSGSKQKYNKVSTEVDSPDDNNNDNDEYDNESDVELGYVRSDMHSVNSRVTTGNSNSRIKSVLSFSRNSDDELEEDLEDIQVL